MPPALGCRHVLLYKAFKYGQLLQQSTLIRFTLTSKQGLFFYPINLIADDVKNFFDFRIFKAFPSEFAAEIL